MSLNIHADENVDFRIIRLLRESQMTVFSVLEEKPGSDFGELVFSYQDKNVGIIFIRYVQEDLNRIFKNVITVINRYGQTLYNKFVVITPNKIRVRDI